MSAPAASVARAPVEPAAALSRPLRTLTNRLPLGNDCTRFIQRRCALFGSGRTVTDSDHDRTPPRERFAGTEHVFDLHEIATALQTESVAVRDGHRQITIFKEHPLTLVVFDFEAGGRLADHRADAYVTIMALSGLLEVSTPRQSHRLSAGSLLVLDPLVTHDVHAPEPSRMLLASP